MDKERILTEQGLQCFPRDYPGTQAFTTQANIQQWIDLISPTKATQYYVEYIPANVPKNAIPIVKVIVTLKWGGRIHPNAYILERNEQTDNTENAIPVRNITILILFSTPREQSWVLLLQQPIHLYVVW